MDRASILLADDHAILAEGVCRILQPEYNVVGIVSDGRDLVETAIRVQPKIVILDIGLPLLNGIEAARQIRELLPFARIVVLTQQTGRSYVQEAFRAGAQAYLLKQAAASELLNALRDVQQGRYYISPQMMSADVKARFNPKANPAELFGGNLTPRQREVLQLVAEGKASKEIASILGISVKTVEFHRGAIMEELGLRSTAELTRYALELGILT
jgi:DNA-binding NarL/FixJ family response regulator